MKLMSFTVPVLIVSLTAVALSGLSMLTVRASAVSTQASIDLLRIQLRVARLHEQLLRQSRDGVAAQAETLRESASTPREASPVEPWPEGTGASSFQAGDEQP